MNAFETKIKILSCAFIVMFVLPFTVFANEVPEDRTIYAFAPFYFDFGNQGEQVLFDLIDYYHDYFYWDQRETNIPNPSPVVTSLSGLITQLERTTPWGIVLLDSHGEPGWLAVEAYSDKTVRDNKIVSYINSGIPPNDIKDRIVSGQAPYIIIISANYIRNHTSKMGNKSIVFGNFCHSDLLKDAFINGGKVYNYLGFDKSVTLSEGLTTVNTLFQRLGGQIDQKQNYTVEEAMVGMPSYLKHFPKDNNAKKQVVYNSPKILGMTITQGSKTIYDYTYSDLTYPFLDTPYPNATGDLSSCRINPAGVGNIAVKIRFSQMMDWDPAQISVKYDPQGISVGANPVSFSGGSWSKTYFDKDTWEATANIPSGQTNYDGLATVIVRARDSFQGDDSSSNSDGELDTDGDGKYNGQDTVHRFTIDTTPPGQVSNLKSTSHTVSVWSKDKTIDVSWTSASDNTGGSGIDGYSHLWDTLSTTEPDTIKKGEETQTGVTSPALSDGKNYWFHIRTLDNAGNAGTTLHLGPFWIDTTNPLSGILSPENDKYYGYTYTLTTISGTSIDDSGIQGAGVNNVKISIKRYSDNKYWNGENNENNWVSNEYWYTITGNGTSGWWTNIPVNLSDGNYLIRSRATDSAGNIEVPGTGNTFYIDTTAPVPNSFQVKDEAAKNPEFAGKRDVKLYTTVTDNSPVELQFSNDGTNYGTATWTDGTLAPGDEWVGRVELGNNWNLLLGAGEKTVYVKFRDAAGNVSTIILDDKITYDPTAAERTIDTTTGQKKAPQVVPYSNANSLTFTWTSIFTDAQSNIAEFVVEVREIVNQTDNMKKSVNLQATQTSYITNPTEVTLVHSNVYYIRVQARNGAGLDSDWVESNRCVIDRVAPTINIPASFYFKDGIYWVTANKEYIFTATDSLSGVKSITLNGEVTEGSTVSKRFTENTVLTYTAEDRAGNVTTSQSITINIDRNVPVSLVKDAGDFTERTDELKVNVLASNGETGIGGYLYAVSEDIAGSNFIVNWIESNSGNVTPKTLLENQWTEITIKVPNLIEGKKYYIGIIPKDNAGNSGIEKWTDGITVDINYRFWEQTTTGEFNTGDFSVVGIDTSNDELKLAFYHVDYALWKECQVGGQWGATDEPVVDHYKSPVDGDDSTVLMINSNYNATEGFYWQVDLGTVYPIRRVKTKNFMKVEHISGATCGAYSEILYSVDGTNWNQLYSVYKEGNSGVTYDVSIDQTYAPFDVRYFRVKYVPAHANHKIIAYLYTFNVWDGTYPLTDWYTSSPSPNPTTSQLPKITRWTNLVVDEDKPSETNIQYFTQTSIDGTNWYGQAGLNTYDNVTPNIDIQSPKIIQGEPCKYIRWKAYFTSNGTITPVIRSVKVGYIVETIPPPVPTLVSPGYGTTISDATPRFDWTDVSDASGLTYYLEIFNLAGKVLEASGLTVSEYTPTTGLADGKYTWRVIAIDGAGNASWSEVRFLTIDTTPPTTPVVVSPADGSATNATNVRCDWTDVVDVSEVHYILEIDDGLDFQTPLNFSSMTISELVPYVYQQDPTFLPGTYYWRVKTRDIAGNEGNWSVVSKFTIFPADGYNTTALAIDTKHKKLYVGNNTLHPSLYIYDLNDNGIPFWSRGSYRLQKDGVGALITTMVLDPVAEKLYIGVNQSDPSLFVYQLYNGLPQVTGGPGNYQYSVTPYNVTTTGAGRIAALALDPVKRKLYVGTETDSTGNNLHVWDLKAETWQHLKVGRTPGSLVLDSVRQRLYVGEGETVISDNNDFYVCKLDIQGNVIPEISENGITEYSLREPGTGRVIVLESTFNKIYIGHTVGTGFYVNVFLLESSGDLKGSGGYTTPMGDFSSLAIDATRGKFYAAGWYASIYNLNVYDLDKVTGALKDNSQRYGIGEKTRSLLLDPVHNNLYFGNYVEPGEGNVTVLSLPNDIPIVPIRINNGAATTNSNQVTLNLQSANAHFMYLSGDVEDSYKGWVSVDGGRWKNSGEDTRATVFNLPVRLSAGAGKKTVKVTYLEGSAPGYNNTAVYAEASIDLILPPDTTSPVISITNPSPSSFNPARNETLRLEYILSEPGLVKIDVDGIPLVDNEPQTMGVHTFIWDGKNLSGTLFPVGTHNITLTAKDASANLSTPHTVTVNIVPTDSPAISNVSIPSLVKVNQTVRFEYTLTGSGILSGKITITDSGRQLVKLYTITTSGTQEWIPTEQGIYEVELSLTDENNRPANSISGFVTVVPENYQSTAIYEAAINYPTGTTVKVEEVPIPFLDSTAANVLSVMTAEGQFLASRIYDITGTLATGSKAYVSITYDYTKYTGQSLIITRYDTLQNKWVPIDERWYIDELNHRIVVEMSDFASLYAQLSKETIPPVTVLNINQPKSGTDPVYVTGRTKFELTATDNLSGVVPGYPQVQVEEPDGTISSWMIAPSSGFTLSQTLGGMLVNPEYSAACLGSWHFDEGSGKVATDSSVYGNHGTLMGAPRWIDNSISLGKALSFSGEHDSVYVPGNENMVFKNNQFTIEARVYPSRSQSYAPILVQLNACRQGNWELYLDSQELKFHYGLTNGQEMYLRPNIIIPLYQWSHILVICDGGTIKFYVNGILKGTAGVGGTVSSTILPIYIGGLPGCSYPYLWAGAIDEVAIYNRALSDREINVRTGAPQVADKTLLGAWSFNEGTGITVKDSSSYNHQGTLVNGVLWSSGAVAGTGTEFPRQYGTAIDIVQPGAYVEVAHTSAFGNPYLGFNIPKLTIEAWVYQRDRTGHYDDIIVDKDSTHRTVAGGYTLGTTARGTGKVWFKSYGVNINSQRIESVRELTLNEWHYIVYVYDGYTARIYIDGELDTETPWSELRPSSDKLRIGHTILYAGSSGETRIPEVNWFNGKIDEVKLWYRAVSAEEIRRNYTGVGLTTYKLSYQSVDKAGNVEKSNPTSDVQSPKSMTMVVDDDPPGVWLSLWPGYSTETDTYISTNTKVQVVADDLTGSGVDSIQWSVDGAPVTERKSLTSATKQLRSDGLPLSAGVHTVQYTGLDYLQQGTTRTITVKVDDKEPRTTSPVISPSVYVDGRTYIIPETTFTLLSSDMSGGEVNSGVNDINWRVLVSTPAAVNGNTLGLGQWRRYPSSGNSTFWLGENAGIKPRADASTVGLWHFDEGSGNVVHDSAGTFPDISINDYKWTWVNNKFGYSIYQLLADIRTINAPSVNLPEFTVEAWLNMSIDGGFLWLDGAGVGYGPPNPIQPVISFNGTIVELRNGGYLTLVLGEETLVSKARINYEEWTHIAVTYQPGIVKFYVNGIKKDILFTVRTTGAHSGGLAIGQAYHNGRIYFRGCIDELHLRNKALNEDEMFTSYAGLPLTVLESETTLEYYSTDRVGNKEPTQQYNFTVDITPPVTTLVLGEYAYVTEFTGIPPTVGPKTPLLLSVQEKGSGIDTTQYPRYRIYPYNTSGDTVEWQVCRDILYIPSDLADGEYVIDYYSADRLGNTEPVRSTRILVDNTVPQFSGSVSKRISPADSIGGMTLDNVRITPAGVPLGFRLISLGDVWWYDFKDGTPGPWSTRKGVGEGDWRVERAGTDDYFYRLYSWDGRVPTTILSGLNLNDFVLEMNLLLDGQAGGGFRIGYRSYPNKYGYSVGFTGDLLSLLRYDGDGDFGRETRKVIKSEFGYPPPIGQWHKLRIETQGTSSKVFLAKNQPNYVFTANDTPKLSWDDSTYTQGGFYISSYYNLCIFDNIKIESSSAPAIGTVESPVLTIPAWTKITDFRTEQTVPPGCNILHQYQSWRVLMEDEFTSGSSASGNWIVTNPAGTSNWLIENQEYSQDVRTSYCRTVYSPPAGTDWQDYSFAAWFKVIEKDNSSEIQFLVKAGTVAGAEIRFILQYLSGGTAKVSMYNGYRNQYLVKDQPVTVAVNDNEWHRSEVVVSGKYYQWYVDGMLQIEYYDFADTFRTGGVGLATQGVHTHFDTVKVFGTTTGTGWVDIADVGQLDTSTGKIKYRANFVRSESADKNPDLSPTLRYAQFTASSSVRVTPEIVSTGTVTIEFVGWEPLHSSPTVTVNAQPANFYSFSSPYNYKYQITDTDRDGIARIRIQGTDLVGNTGVDESGWFVIDRTAPEVTTQVSTGTFVQTGGGTIYVSTTTSLSFTVVDTLSAVSTVYYQIQPSSTAGAVPEPVSTAWQSPPTDGGFTLTEEGIYTVYYKSMDTLGNTVIQSTNIVVDITAPITTITSTDTFRQGEGGGTIYVTSMTPLSLNTVDTLSAVSTVSYQVQPSTAEVEPVSSEWLPSEPGGVVTLSSEDGVYTVYYKSTDLLGNTVVRSTGVVVDNIAPTASITTSGGVVVQMADKTYVTSASSFTVSAVDNLSGVSTVSYQVQSGTVTEPVSSEWQPVPAEGVRILDDGVYAVYYKSIDLSGNTVTLSTNVVVDNTAPMTSIAASGGVVVQVADKTYVTSASSFTISAVDNLSGVSTVSYQVQPSTVTGPVNSDWQPAPAEGVSIIDDGVYTVYYRSIDVLDNTVVQSTTVVVDNTAPETSIAASGGTIIQTADKTYVTSASSFTVSAVDSLSGVSTVSYQVQSGTVTEPVNSDWQPAPAEGVSIIDDGVYKVYYKSTDILGNTVVQSTNVVVDNTAPMTSIAASGGIVVQTADKTYVTSASSFTVSAVDKLSGVSIVSYQVQPYTITEPIGTEWQPVPADGFTSPVEDGVYTVFYRSIDVLDNTVVQSTTVVVDNTAPETSITASGGTIIQTADKTYVTSASSFTVSAVDKLSAVSTVSYQVQPSTITEPVSTEWQPAPAEGVRILDDGVYTVYYKSIDILGNTVVQSTNVVVDNTAPVVDIEIPNPEYIAIRDVLVPAFQVTDAGPYTSYAYLTLVDTPNPDVVGSTIPVNSGQRMELLSLPYYGDYTLTVVATDWAGHQVSSVTARFTVIWDIQPPRSELIVGSPQFAADSKTYITSDTKIFLFLVDDLIEVGDNNGLGIKETKYRIDESEWQVYTGSFTIPGEGLHRLFYYSLDVVGNTEITKTFTVFVDTTPPTTLISIGTPQYSVADKLWVINNTVFTFTSKDGGIDPCGVLATEYKIDDGNWVVYSEPFTLSAYLEGEHRVEYRSKDNLGNNEPIKTIPVILDNTSPTTDISIGTPKDREYVTSATPLVLTALDGGVIPCGVKLTEYQINSSGWIPYRHDFTLSGTDGKYNIAYRSKDNLDTQESDKILSLKLDNTVPYSSLLMTGGVQYTSSAGKLYASVDTHYILRSTDPVINEVAVGLAEINYRINEGHFLTYVGDITLPEGVHSIEYLGIDKLGNQEQSTRFTVQVDVTPPVTQLIFEGVKYVDSSGRIYISPVETRLKFTAADPAVSDVSAGVYQTQYAIDDSTFTIFISTFSLSTPGVHVIKFFSTDKVGNTESVKTVTVYVDDTPAQTTVAVGLPKWEAFNHLFINPESLITLNSTDPVIIINSNTTIPGAGVKTVYYAIDNQPFTVYGTPFTLELGTHTVRYYAVDNVANTEPVKSFSVNVTILTDYVAVGTDKIRFNGKIDVAGNLRSNGAVTLKGKVTVTGNVYGKQVKLGKKSTVSGNIVETAPGINSEPIDLMSIIDNVSRVNDNLKIPVTGKGKNPVDKKGQLVLADKDSLTLSTGTYYFTGVRITGRSELKTNGPVNIVSTGDVRFIGRIKVNPNNPVDKFVLFVSTYLSPPSRTYKKGDDDYNDDEFTVEDTFDDATELSEVFEEEDKESGSDDDAELNVDKKGKLRCRKEPHRRIPKVYVGGRTEINALVYAPASELAMVGNNLYQGNLFVKETKVNGKCTLRTHPVILPETTNTPIIAASNMFTGRKKSAVEFNEIPIDTTFALGDAYVTPNPSYVEGNGQVYAALPGGVRGAPSRSGGIRLTMIVGLADKVKARIYTVAGELVYEGELDGSEYTIIQGANNKPALAYVINWSGINKEGTKVIPGVYICIMDAEKRGYSPLRKSSKLAIVR